MKILITQWSKEQLPPGTHDVRIDKVEEGKTSNGIEYFECFFSGYFGYCSSRFYITEKSLNRVISLFKACLIRVYKDECLDTVYLQGKHLKIENVGKVIDGNYIIETVAFYPSEFQVEED
jgi:hypothetical protein